MGQPSSYTVVLIDLAVNCRSHTHLTGLLLKPLLPGLKPSTAKDRVASTTTPFMKVDWMSQVHCDAVGERGGYDSAAGRQAGLHHGKDARVRLAEGTTTTNCHLVLL